MTKITSTSSQRERHQRELELYDFRGERTKIVVAPHIFPRYITTS